MKIYLKLQNKPETIKELLLVLFSNGNNGNRTNVKTYFDENCTILQCDHSKFRSYDDVKLIVRTYFPVAIDEEIIHELITLDFGLDTPLYIRMTNCSTIQRIVFYYTTNYFDTKIFNIDKYDSIYSWDYLLSLLNIGSIADLKEYVNQYIKVKKDITKQVIGLNSLRYYVTHTLNENFTLPYVNATNKLEKHLNAVYILTKVAEIYNEGVKLDWNDIGQFKYIPYKYFYRNGSDTYYSCLYSNLTSFGYLFYKSNELSRASYENFT